MSINVTNTLYDSLKEGELRYIALLPSKFNDPIQCLLLKGRDLSRYVRYEALSYEWGSPEPAYFITVNGIKLLIRENLSNALRYLRREGSEHLMWVDAICINQGDIQGKNAQVPIMSKIYGRATEVLAWLGRECDDSPWLSQTIAQIHQNPDFDFSDLNPPEERMMRAITKLWNRSYWKRVWIIQEILSASNLSLYCGAESLPWTAYENILVTGWRPQYSAGGTISRLYNTKERELLRLENLLTLCAHCKAQCTDIRDRIYGFLSILSDVTREEITVDYSKEPVVLFLDVMYMYMAKLSDTAPHYFFTRGMIELSETLQALLENPLWNSIETSIGISKQINCGGILHKLSGELQEVHFIPVAKIEEMGPVIMSNDSLRPNHLPLSRHHTATSVLRLLRSNIDPQDFHRCQALEKSFKRKSDSENFFATSEGIGEDAITFRWHYPTDGKCRIIEPFKNHIGIASCKTQVGDFLCFAEGVKNLCVILRLPSSVTDAARVLGTARVSGADELILVGRVIFLDPPKSTDISLWTELTSKYSYRDNVNVCCEIDFSTLLLLAR